MQKLLLCSKIRKLTRLVKPIPWEGGEQHEILTMSEGRTDATQQLSTCAVPPTGEPRDRQRLSLHLLPAHLPGQPQHSWQHKPESQLYLLGLFTLPAAVMLSWMSSVRTIIKAVLYHSCDKNKKIPTKPSKSNPGWASTQAPQQRT